jgi:hypothetical protein
MTERKSPPVIAPGKWAVCALGARRGNLRHLVTELIHLQLVACPNIHFAGSQCNGSDHGPAVNDIFLARSSTTDITTTGLRALLRARR